MQIKLSLNKGLSREFEIVIDAGEVEKRTVEKLTEISKTAKLAGFRPGKIPLSVVKTRYGDQSKGEVIQAMLDEAAREAIDTNDLNLASQPSLDITAYEDGKNLEAKLKCEVLPEIDLPNITEMSIERPTLPLDEKEVTGTMQRLAQENSPTEKAKKGHKAVLGDVVIIDFEGSIDGVPFEGGAAKGHSLELGSNSFIPGFEEGLLGSKAGDTKNVDVSFPENYQASQLAGKQAVFAVNINEVRVKGKPVLDDALSEKLGFDKLTALEEAVRGQLSVQHQPALRQLVKKNILDQLNEYANFDVPQTLLDSEYDVVAKSIKSEQGINNDNDHEREHDQDSEDIHSEKNNADEGLDDEAKKEALEIATRRVRLGLMLTEIGRTNGIKVSEEDTKRAIFEQAKKYPGQEKQIIEYYQKNPEATQQLAGPLFEDKVIDYVLEIAKVTDVETDISALYGSQEGSSKEALKKSAKKKTKVKPKSELGKSGSSAEKKKQVKKKATNKSNVSKKNEKAAVKKVTKKLATKKTANKKASKK